MQKLRLCLVGPILLFLAGCATFQIPKEYVPDEKVVYLKQNLEFGPIRYEAVAADPYVFEPDSGQVNVEKPTFLRTLRWETLLKADFKADSFLLRELEGHVRYILDLPTLKGLRSRLDAAKIEATPPLPPNLGEKTKDYSNGASYVYPDVPGAQITVLNDGYYSIDFPDKGSFKYWQDGSYARTDGKGNVIFKYDAKDTFIVSTVDGYTFTESSKHRAVKGPEGNLEYHPAPFPQYQFTPAGDASAPLYILFIDEGKNVISCAIQPKGGLRIDYFPDKKSTLVTSGAQAIGIDAEFRKRHSRFDTEKRVEGELLSLYLPEGLRLTNFEGPNLAFAEINPAWPENYKVKTLGPFDFLYTAKDEPLLAKLKPAVLSDFEAKARRLSGLTAMKRRTILIPPDLESYRKLHASRPGEVLNWYPSGFESRDFIVMWPISVPRYNAQAGQDYFFDREFYEILVHEYVHVMVDENTGLQSPVPVWLNEGLAVYVESQLSPESQFYWDLTFEVSRGLKKLLDWDLVTTTSTGELEIAKARVHYAQSYAMVRALVQKFGIAKLAAYVKSFRVKTTEIEKVDLKADYKTRFKTVFGAEWETAPQLLQPTEEG